MGRKLEKKTKGLDSQVLEKINASITTRKPAYLVALLVDMLKDNGDNKRVRYSVAESLSLIDPVLQDRTCLECEDFPWCNGERFPGLRVPALPCRLP